MTRSTGLQTTFQLLGSIPVESATRLLISALDSPVPDIADEAVGALIERRNAVGQAELLRRLHMLSPRARAIIDQNCGCLSHVLRDAILGTDSQTFVNACREILRTNEYPLIPALISALEDVDHPNGDLAAQTLLSLADLLLDDLTTQSAQGWKNPQATRMRAIESLELSINRFNRHRRREVIEAYLRLANRGTASLLEILNSPHHPAYLVVCDVLARSQHPTAGELLISFLADPVAPSAALAILGRRTDGEFLSRLFEFLDARKTPAVEKNLKRIEAIAWVFGKVELLDDLSDAAQQQAIHMAIASRIKRSTVSRLVAHLLQHGKTEARRTAARVFTAFTGATANDLVWEMLNDPDPIVQATLVGQIRARGIHGALPRLMEKVDSPVPQVREAACQSLAEFNFDRYLTTFETLDPAARQSTGEFIKRVDPRTVPRLREELHSPVRSRRLRGLAIAESIGAIPEVEDSIIELLSDADGFIRAEAARRLAFSLSPTSRAALEIACLDDASLVKEAAEQALLDRASNAARVTVPVNPPLPTFAEVFR